MKIKVIGAGLAGVEAGICLAERGVEVELYDIKPKSFTPAHSYKGFGELVCSNSLKSNDVYGNACGLLKEEMRRLGSLVIEAADKTRVPAGGALAVERESFSDYITSRIYGNKNITVICEEIKKVPKENCIVATGPLTCGALSEDIGDRYGKGGDDYINCPLNKEEYESFVEGLLNAEKVILRDFEKREIFEGCMPVEVLASRGKDSLRFAMLKPVGLTDGEGNKYYAVLQLRKENAEGTAYNLVGCQTNLKFGEQKRVFSLIPALKNAEFLRYGVMHRNTFINSPNCLNADFSLKTSPTVFFAGQITGVEGYVESAASGLLAGLHAFAKLNGKQPVIPDNTTVLGALSAHIAGATDNFQPMNANFGILKSPEIKIRDKKQRYAYLAKRSLESIDKYIHAVDL